MKHLIGILAFTTALLGVTSQAHAQNEQEVSFGVGNVYVPSGLDATSEVVVVITGVFPTACYRWHRAILYRQGGMIRVETRALYRDTQCLLVLVPFRESVYLGVLGSGEHLVRFDAENGSYLDIKIVID